jgi:hypothetical protein
LENEFRHSSWVFSIPSFFGFASSTFMSDWGVFSCYTCVREEIIMWRHVYELPLIILQTGMADYRIYILVRACYIILTCLLLLTRNSRTIKICMDPCVEFVMCMILLRSI